jgi:hypothetical protein
VFRGMRVAVHRLAELVPSRVCARARVAGGEVLCPLCRAWPRWSSANDAALAQRRDILGGKAVSGEDLVAVLAKDR